MLSENLKQRIVGGFVLLALALILFALLFDFSDVSEIDTRSQIPDSPDISPVVVAEPVRAENIDAAADDESIFLPEIPEGTDTDVEDETSSSGSESPGLTAEGVAEAWVLQVGSFRDAKKAQSLLEQLLAEGYTAYVRQQPGNDSELSRVFVGPKVLKSKLLEEKTAIDKKYGIDALMLRFDP
ncbi:SPOR domain-containing protein [Porticoccus sp.]|uniref:SPOR domain-containing protein n=1 Tax=Porticoccus sp. TaxID=2024853 RepID=UPI003F69AC7D